MIASLQRHAYTWSVQDVDGQWLHERDIVDGPGWARVNLERTSLLILNPQHRPLARVAVQARFDQGESLFFTRRTTFSLDPTRSGQPTVTTIAGTQRPDGGGSYIFLFEDGSILVSTDLNAV